MTNDYFRILKANEISAKFDIDRAFAKVKQSLGEVDYQGNL